MYFGEWQGKNFLKDEDYFSSVYGETLNIPSFSTGAKDLAILYGLFCQDCVWNELILPNCFYISNISQELLSAVLQCNELPNLINIPSKIQ